MNSQNFFQFTQWVLMFFNGHNLSFTNGAACKLSNPAGKEKYTEFGVTEVFSQEQSSKAKNKRGTVWAHIFLTIKYPQLTK